MWKHLGLPDPTPVQYDIAKFLQHGPRRLIIEAFRGIGKSWITSAFVVWLLYRDPQHKVMVVSASKSRADDFSTFTMRLIYEIPQLQHLIPKPHQRQSKLAFDVGPARADHSPSVKSVGITGQLTGSRADTIVADDIEVVSNSATHGMRERIQNLVKEFDAVLKPGGRVIYLGTPQTEQSLYNVLPSRGYAVRIWPVLYPTPKQIERYGNKLAPAISLAIEKDPSLVGMPVDPLRFDREDIEERRLSYGRSGFALQFMLDTSLSDEDRHPLRLSDLIVMSLNPTKAPTDIIWASSPDLIHEELPNVGLDGDRYYRPMHIEKEFAEYTGAIMAVDPSGRGSDETAYAVVKMLHGRLFTTAAGGFKGGYSDETLKNLLQIAKRHEVKLIVVEPNFGDGMFAQLLRAASQEVYRVAIEDAKWSRQQKEARIIDTLEPIMNQHRLVISPEVIEHDFKSTEGYPSEDQNKYRLMYQMTRLTRDRGSIAKDDRLDALAMAVAYWVDVMARNTNRAREDHKERQLKDEFKNWRTTVVMGKVAGVPSRGQRMRSRGGWTGRNRAIR